MIRIVTVVGARPQFVKAAVVSRLIREEFRGRVSEYLIHTGQHYDANMSDVFFQEMEIPPADINLAVGSGGHGQSTGQMLAGIERVLEKEKPDFLLVYGDTNSTLAGALAASKLLIPVVHVEAGLRSFNRSMPEEQNRVVTDHLASWLFCPTDAAVKNLQAEGIRDGDRQVRVVRTGDIMLDASIFYRRKAAARTESIRRKLGLDGAFFLLTVHRAENTDDPARLRAIWEAVSEIGIKGVCPLHPRTRKMVDSLGLGHSPNVEIIEPVGYLDMIELESGCSFILTDSGGVQKEAFFFGKPCLTLRDETEWVETTAAGWNTLVGADKGKILSAVKNMKVPAAKPDLYGSGDAGREILDSLLKKS